MFLVDILGELWGPSTATPTSKPSAAPAVQTKQQPSPIFDIPGFSDGPVTPSVLTCST